MALVTYGGWLALTYEHARLPLPVLAVLGGCVIALQGSLQHETIHGHPAGPAWVGRLLGGALVTRAMLANLGMYDGGELAAANDVLWGAIASRLEGAGVANVPRQLERRLPLADLWASGDLLFGQTCGHPFAARYYGRLRLIAAPRYALPGCREGRHRSFVIVSARSAVRDVAALRGARATINDDESMTGPAPPRRSGGRGRGQGRLLVKSEPK